uniref:ATP synthase complex subunit 8 n=1 Tax=Cerceris quinquefasciata TaxID=2026451 RepID=A0A8B0JTJ8_9HYME|nr:ATP synthase F0 subunit 8 [Cerceris quinquefasciata]QTV22615.1 ATP synthase F0 subunit 8 [Cerceris quinquefasciata]
MPQMSPSNWLLIYLMSISLLLIIMSMIFNNLNMKNKLLNINKIFNKKWTWKW